MTDSYIYIDDSGDPGLRGECSANFIIASVVLVGKEKREKLEGALLAYRSGLGWSNDRELKFHKSGKDVIDLAIRAIRNYDYCVYAIVIDKKKIDFKQLSSIERNAIFLYTIKELLLKLRVNNADIFIDGVRGPKYVRKARAYLRQELKKNGLSVHRIAFEDSKKNSLIQLADLAAGAVARLVSGKDDGDRYVRLFGEKLREIFRN